MALANAYDRWIAADAAWMRDPSRANASAVDAALEALSALAFQEGHDPASDVDVVAWIIAKMADDERS